MFEKSVRSTRTGENPQGLNRDMTTRSGLPRPVEVTLAVVCLIVASPLIAAAAVIVKLTSRGPAIFRQQRIGLGGRRFVLYKLRTMTATNAGVQVTSSDDHRVTAAGKLLRRSKLDELPELWNVIKGDMSLVGARPEVPEYVDTNDTRWSLILQSRPGITDPMTVQLRNEERMLAGLSEGTEQFYLEVLQPYKIEGYMDYCRRRSWKTDVQVLWRTLVAVFFPSKTPTPSLQEIRSAKTPLNVKSD